MTICRHQNFEIVSHPTMAGNGYHDCDYMECLDCDSIAPMGDCDIESCDNF